MDKINTIIIPTKDRPTLFRRTLQHLHNEACKFPILVVDGSAPAGKAANASACIEFLDLNIHHRSVNPDRSICEQIYQCMELVDTELCTFHADDDFMRMEAIKQAATVLLENPNVSVVHGPSLYMHLHDSKVEFSIYKNRSVKEHNAYKRLTEWFRPYGNTVHAVRRTQQFSTLLNIGQQLEFRILEWVFALLDAISGQCLMIEDLYMVRTSHPNQANRRELKWPDYLFTPSAPIQIARLKELVIAHALELYGGQTDEWERYIDRGLANYLAYAGLPEPTHIHPIVNQYAEHESNNLVLQRAQSGTLQPRFIESIRQLFEENPRQPT